MQKFEMKDLSPKDVRNFPLTLSGINIQKSAGAMFLNQKDPNQKVLSKFNMTDLQNTGCDTQKLNLPCRELIGFFMYIMLGTRPDLSRVFFLVVFRIAICKNTANT